MSIVIAVILPACVGIWLVLPSLQALIVPQQYRGPFGQLLTLMMPGLFFFALILYAINPIFQIAKRTAPLIARRGGRLYQRSAAALCPPAKP